MNSKPKGLMLSIEMSSTSNVKSIFISNKNQERALFEGNLGELENLDLVEGSMLVVKGTNGILRVELEPKDSARLISLLTKSQSTLRVKRHKQDRRKDK